MSDLIECPVHGTWFDPSTESCAQCPTFRSRPQPSGAPPNEGPPAPPSAGFGGDDVPRQHSPPRGGFGSRTGSRHIGPDTIVTFGKYRGQRAGTVTDGYWDWADKNLTGWTIDPALLTPVPGKHHGTVRHVPPQSPRELPRTVVPLPPPGTDVPPGGHRGIDFTKLKLEPPLQKGESRYIGHNIHHPDDEPPF